IGVSRRRVWYIALLRECASTPLGVRGAHRASACSASAGSTGYLAFQASKPPSRAAALKPNLFSLRAARALVASSGQVQ
ncbi:MAG: hypothetical protein M3305_17190, partial [Actinomycetota bacterium]|nr:hypothetical protein [Actinomycetota bacterium]